MGRQCSTNGIYEKCVSCVPLAEVSDRERERERERQLGRPRL